MFNFLVFGDNQYRKCEEGEMPKDPHFFLEILKLAQNQFPDDGILKIEKKSERAIVK